MRAILTYHSIDPSGSPISIDVESFRRHVRWLASGRVTVTTVDQLLAAPDEDDAVALTFDDGFRNFGELAAPMLRDHGLPATLFIVTDRAGETNAWAGEPAANVPTLPLLGWDQIARLAEGDVTIGAHTRTHRSLTGLRGAALEDEVAGCAARIGERLGRPPRIFAYPYGSVDPAASVAVSATYAWGCTTELRALRQVEEAALLPRLDMYYFRAPRGLEAWGTARFHLSLRLRAHARRVRRTLTMVPRS